MDRTLGEPGGQAVEGVGPAAVGVSRVGVGEAAVLELDPGTPVLGAEVELDEGLAALEGAFDPLPAVGEPGRGIHFEEAADVSVA